jgi:hypothetical protein
MQENTPEKETSWQKQPHPPLRNAAAPLGGPFTNGLRNEVNSRNGMS